MGLLCFFGIHSWVINKEKHKVVGHPHRREYIRVRIRECQHCGKRQYFKKKLQNLWCLRWKTFTFDKNSILNYKNIN